MMTAESPALAAAPGAPSNRRVLFASMVGTAVEYYDFYIYATAAALLFGPLFFPSVSSSAQMLSSYATIAVAFFARPLGAAVFGHFGDRVGRKSTLVASLLTMGLATVLIGVLPSYEQIGWVAPVLLCIMRFAQGFGLGGEWGGAALLAVENAPPGWRSRFGTAPQQGAPVGFIAANGLFLLLGYILTPEQFTAWGWRIPFLCSAALVALGLWVRLNLSETPAFKAAMAEGPPEAAPVREVFFGHPLATLSGILTAVACFATFYLSTAFALGYAVKTLGYRREDMLAVQLGAIVFMAISTWIAGWGADRSNPRRVLMAGCAMGVVVGLLMPVMFVAGSLPTVFVFLSLALFAMGLMYGPLGSFVPDLFPTRVRYSGSTLAFNIGGIIGGGFAPMIAAALAEKGGLPPVGVYLAGACLLSLITLAMLANRKHHGLE